MSNINSNELFQDISSETAASYSGGRLRRVSPTSKSADIILYEHANGRGDRIAYDASGAGDGLRNIGGVWNDKVSSIRVRRGTWDFYQDSNFRGDSAKGLRARSRVYNLGHNNDAITSFRRIG